MSPLLNWKKENQKPKQSSNWKKMKKQGRKVCPEQNETELHLPKWKDGRLKLSWMTGRKGGQREERRQTWKETEQRKKPQERNKGATKTQE